MKVLILSANTGGGHNSAAHAIAGALEERGISCTIQNALRFVPRVMEGVIVKSHYWSTKNAPELYAAGYEYEEKHDISSWTRSFDSYAPVLRNYIRQGGYDTVICVHVFAGFLMTAIRRKWPSSLKQYFVATDYTCSPGVDQLDVDGIFVPKGLSLEFLIRDIKPELLYETGIPVRLSCYEPMTRDFAREQLYHEVPCTPQDKLVFIGPLTMEKDDLRLVSKAVERWVPEVKFIIVTGKGNRKLKQHIEEWRDPHVRPLSFTSKMDLWMKASDVFITKPGGLTSTEAVSSHTPLLLLDVVPGLETHNRDHLVNLGCATSATGVPAVCRAIVRLLQDESAVQDMFAAQEKNFSARAAAKLVDVICAQAAPAETSQDA